LLMIQSPSLRLARSPVNVCCTTLASRGYASMTPRRGEGHSKAECHECQKTCHVQSSSDMSVG
jgi:hypothetical protein